MIRYVAPVMMLVLFLQSTGILPDQTYELSAPAAGTLGSGADFWPSKHHIPGLYAAGEVTGGIHGGNRLGGNAVPTA